MFTLIHLFSFSKKHTIKCARAHTRTNLAMWVTLCMALSFCSHLTPSKKIKSFNFRNQSQQISSIIQKIKKARAGILQFSLQKDLDDVQQTESVIIEDLSRISSLSNIEATQHQSCQQSVCPSYERLGSQHKMALLQRSLQKAKQHKISFCNSKSRLSQIILRNRSKNCSRADMSLEQKNQPTGNSICSISNTSVLKLNSSSSTLHKIKGFNFVNKRLNAKSVLARAAAASEQQPPQTQENEH